MPFKIGKGSFQNWKCYFHFGNVLADKLSDQRSEISEAIGLQEIYLSDQLSDDFDTTGQISLKEGSIMF